MFLSCYPSQILLCWRQVNLPLGNHTNIVYLIKAIQTHTSRRHFIHTQYSDIHIMQGYHSDTAWRIFRHTQLSYRDIIQTHTALMQGYHSTKYGLYSDTYSSHAGISFRHNMYKIHHAGLSFRQNRDDIKTHTSCRDIIQTHQG